MTLALSLFISAAQSHPAVAPAGHPLHRSQTPGGEYDQAQVSGPPHAVEQAEVEALFGLRCEVDLLDTFVTTTLPPHFQNQGVSQAAESVYLITKNS